MSSTTSLGRVQPKYVGEWSSITTYNKLDNVLYEGSSYVSKVNTNVGHEPPIGASSNDYWIKIASKGDTGNTGEQGPRGAQGVQGEAGTITIVNVETLGPNDSAYVINSGTPQAASLYFGIPKGAPGTGAVSQVDNLFPESGDVRLTAVQFGRVQDAEFFKSNFGIPSEAVASVMLEYQARARANIRAQVAGNYPVLPTATIPTNGQALIYNEGWTTRTINEVPAGSDGDVMKFLRKVSNGIMWDKVYAIPSGGNEGEPLVKTSNNNYEYGWGSFISPSDIDALFT